MKLADYFENIKNNHRYLRVWYSYMEEDEPCDHVIIKEVFTDSKGDLVGILKTDEKERYQEFLKAEDIRLFAYCKSDQTLIWGKSL